jgi:hypothetical protein
MSASRFGSLVVALAALLLVSGCRDAGVTVEQRTGEGWQPMSYRLASVESLRDGYVTESQFRLVDDHAGELFLVLRVAVDPTARLEGGRWTRTAGGEMEDGAVVPIQVEFLGGQGSGASVGGRFLLQEAGTPRYRVQLPPTAPAPSYR